MDADGRQGRSGLAAGLVLCDDACIDESGSAHHEAQQLPAEAVRSPTTPHPGSMFPPPPLGEPPQLQHNKRPHGLASSGSHQQLGQLSIAASTSAMPDYADSVDPNAVTAAVAAAVAPALDVAPCCSSPGSPGSPSRSSSSCQEDDEDTGEVEMPDAAKCVSRPSSPPAAAPPGPPPAEMAPPPPPGQPPSLPLDRQELKRSVQEHVPQEEPGRPPFGKKLRFFQQASDEGAAPGGAPTDAKACVPTSSKPEPDISMECQERQDHGADSDGLEQSYVRAPASARWVWDRMVSQQDGLECHAGVLQKRVLRALDELSVGASQ